MASGGATLDAAVRAGEPKEHGMKGWVFCVIAAALGAPVASCVLADPPATLPPVPNEPPDLGLAMASPQQGPISTWPDTVDGFVIPVYVGDPSQTIEWIAYVDPNPDLSVDTPISSKNGAPVPVLAQDGGWVRLIRAVLPEPLEPGCHTIVIVVAYAFSQGTPIPVFPPGPSMISWTFNNSADPFSCGSYDAGSLADAASSGDAP
jgi:hypothetical protein